MVPTSLQRGTPTLKCCVITCPCTVIIACEEMGLRGHYLCGGEYSTLSGHDVKLFADTDTTVAEHVNVFVLYAGFRVVSTAQR